MRTKEKPESGSRAALKKCDYVVANDDDNIPKYKKPVNIFSEPSPAELCGNHKYNGNLIKILFNAYGIEAGNHYRYRVIARNHFKDNSGIFTPDQFMDLLHTEYDYKSLNHLPGNDRTKFRRKLLALLKVSMLFERLPDGRYKFIAESKLTYTGKFTDNHHMNDNEIYSQRLFNNAMIAIMSMQGMKSVKYLHKKTGFSITYIKAALRQQEEIGRIKKYNNIALAECYANGNYNKLRSIQQDLIKRCKIKTKIIYIYSSKEKKKVPHIGLYLANSYINCIDAKKGEKKTPCLTHSKNCKRYKIVKPNYQKNVHLWTLNDYRESAYNMSDYIEDYAV